MNRTLLLGLSCILFAGCGGKPKPAFAPAPSNVVAIPPDSPKLAQIRVEPIKSEAMPADDATAPGKVEGDLNRFSRVPPPVAGRMTQALVKLGDSVTAGQNALPLRRL
jgi:multidrug efflux pump subunit AcrA (membrane-fusion protein)